MQINYHTHTWRCNHASGTERDYIERAIAAGMRVLGFADHVPYPYMNGDHYSSFRMKPEQVPEYVSTLSALREEYKDRIRILIGYEAEYYPDVFPDMLNFLEEYGYDYLILGQHHIGSSREDIHFSGHPTDDESLLDQYVTQVIEGLQTGAYKYLAHPDLIHFTGDDAVYRKYAKILCEEAKAMDIPLEVNMLGLADGRHYPSDRFFAVAAETGNNVVMGCDAHSPEFIGNPELEKKTLQFIEKFPLTLLTEF